MFELPATDVWLIIGATNLAYLLAAVVAWTRRLYDLVAVLAIVAVISTIHHICDDAHLCNANVNTIFGVIDVVAAYNAIAMGIMFVVNYDLVKVADRVASDDVAIYMMATIESVSSRYVLVKHTYADIATMIYFTLNMFAVMAFNGSIVEPLIVFGYGLLVIGLSFAFYWRMKVATMRRRFNWWFMGIAAALAVAGMTLFAGEAYVGRSFHAVWHVDGAATCIFLLLGASRHLKIDALPWCSSVFARP